MIGLEDQTSKKDIMSLLVRARIHDASAKSAGDRYTLTDKAMVDQVVSGSCEQRWKVVLSLSNLRHSSHF